MISTSVSIAFVGDIMPGGILHGKSSGISNDIKRYLDSFNLRVGTLECAIGNEPNFDPIKMNLKQDVIYAPNCDLDKLKEININLVSLANNHAFDLGLEGLINTMNQLESVGIVHIGAGRNISEASKPAVFTINGIKIGFIALCDFRDETVGYVPIATATSPGMNSIKDETYIKQITTLKSEVDFLYVIIHWGVEHSFWPTIHTINVARKIIKAGVDGIIGGHQHRIQPFIKIKGKPVFFGLGNFLFPPRFLRPPRPMYYPAPNEDTSNYPITDGYPWIEKPTYKIWKKLGKIGEIASIKIKNSHQDCTYKLVGSNLDNKINFIPQNALGLRNQIEYNIAKISVSFGCHKYFYYPTLFSFKILRKIINNLKVSR